LLTTQSIPNKLYQSLPLKFLLITISAGCFLFSFVEKAWEFSLIFGLGTLVSGILITWVQQPRWKNWTLILMSVFACLAIGEILCLLFNRSEDSYSGEYTTSYFRSDVENAEFMELGYEPNPGRFSVQKYQGDQLVYNQIYTITPQRIRETPLAHQAEGCNVVFFGGSFTFGEGVSDHETMAYFFAKEGGGKFNVYNLGFHGYGPHQMLRALETERLKSIVGGPVHLVIYQGFQSHVDRVAGNTFWDHYGPRYTLMPDGSVQYQGPFHGKSYRFFHDLVRKSALYVFIQERLIQLHSFDSENIPLYLGVLKQSRRMVEHNLHAPFYVLFWDKGAGNILTDEIVKKMEDNQFGLIKVSQIIPEIQANQNLYTLSPYDTHPNPLAYHLIGSYLKEAFTNSPCDFLTFNQPVSK
jgi:hypothetical protein